MIPPLSGTRVVVTRPEGQAAGLTKLLEAAGAEVIAYPTIAIVPVEAPDEVRRAREAVARLATNEYDGLLLTSQNAVRFFVPLLEEAGVAVSALPTSFAIGAATAAPLEALGLTPVVAQKNTADGLADEVITHHHGSVDGRLFLFLRAKNGRDTLINRLVAAGAGVELVTHYETVALVDGPPLPGPVDWVTFTSPSAIEGLVARNPDLHAKFACIGPTTAQAARAHRLDVHAIPDKQSNQAMVEAIVQSVATPR